MTRLVWTPALFLALSAVACADVAVFKDGTRLEGVVTITETEVTVKTRFGTYTRKREELQELLPQKTPLEEYQERRAALREPDAEALYQLALWCEGKALRREAKACLQEALERDGNHAATREKLGYVRELERWVKSSPAKTPAAATESPPREHPQEKAASEELSRLEKAIAAKPDDAAALAAIIPLYHRLGKAQEAERAAKHLQALAREKYQDTARKLEEIQAEMEKALAAAEREGSREAYQAKKKGLMERLRALPQQEVSFRREEFEVEESFAGSTPVRRTVQVLEYFQPTTGDTSSGWPVLWEFLVTDEEGELIRKVFLEISLATSAKAKKTIYSLDENHLESGRRVFHAAYGKLFEEHPAYQEVRGLALEVLTGKARARSYTGRPAVRYRGGEERPDPLNPGVV